MPPLFFVRVPHTLLCLWSSVRSSASLPLDNSRYNDHNRPMPPRRSPIPLPDQLFVSMLKTADSLTQGAELVIKPSGLTPAQYNVLRILRGAEPDGLLCRGIADRMISRDPDMTRLLDRMENRGWITRERQKDDRRIIKARITPEGLKLVKSLDEPIHELHHNQFRHIPPARQKLLAELLQQLASPEPE